MLESVVRITVALFNVYDEFASVAHDVDIRENELFLRYIDLVIANEVVNAMDFESLFVGINSPQDYCLHSSQRRVEFVILARNADLLH